MHAEVSFCTPYTHSTSWFFLRVTGGLLCYDPVERINSGSEVFFFWVWNHFLSPQFGGRFCQGQQAVLDKVVVFPLVFDLFIFFFPVCWVSMSWPIWICLEWKFLNIFRGWPWLHSALALETSRSLDRKVQTDVTCKIRCVFKPLKLWEENRSWLSLCHH